MTEHAAPLQIRLHGRGGQGVVTSAELLSSAAFIEGRHAQAFPSFGSERTGAPVVAFCRIADAAIRTHEPIAEPDVILIQDPTLVHQEALFSGLPAHGTIIINSSLGLDHLGLTPLTETHRVVAIPATELAREHLGRPMPGAPLLGAFAALTGAVSVDALARAIESTFGGAVAAGNVAAARAAFAYIQEDRRVAAA